VVPVFHDLSNSSITAARDNLVRDGHLERVQPNKVAVTARCSKIGSDAPSHEATDGHLWHLRAPQAADGSSRPRGRHDGQAVGPAAPTTGNIRSGMPNGDLPAD
jgi:hypothetical protein